MDQIQNIGPIQKHLSTNSFNLSNWKFKNNFLCNPSFVSFHSKHISKYLYIGFKIYCLKSVLYMYMICAKDIIFLIIDSFKSNRKRYRPFHKTLPCSSAFTSRISVRFYETDYYNNYVFLWERTLSLYQLSYTIS